MRATLPSLLVGLLLLSCSRSLPSMEGIDMMQWREDKNGCSLYRLSRQEELRKQAGQLKSMTEMDVVQLLGRPDRNELYKRNQKFFQYYLMPSAVCNRNGPDSLRLVLRFNAVGLVREVTFE